MIISGLDRPIKCILRPTAFKAKRVSVVTLCYIILLFYHAKLTISPLDRPRGFRRGFP